MRTLVPLSLASAAVLGLAIAQLRKQRRDGAETSINAITIRREQDDVERHVQEVGLSHRVRLSAAPGGRGTEVRVEAREGTPPDLRKLKQVLETGEVAVSDATVERSDLLQRHAQPVGAQS